MNLQVLRQWRYKYYVFWMWTFGLQFIVTTSGENCNSTSQRSQKRSTATRIEQTFNLHLINSSRCTCTQNVGPNCCYTNLRKRITDIAISIFSLYKEIDGFTYLTSIEVGASVDNGRIGKKYLMSCLIMIFYHKSKTY